MTGRTRIAAALTLIAGALILAPLNLAAAPVRDRHDLYGHAPAPHAPEGPGFAKSPIRGHAPHTGGTGYLGLNDMLADPKGRPPRSPGGHPHPNSPVTMLPVPLPATLPLLLGGIALIGVARHRRRRGGD